MDTKLRSVYDNSERSVKVRNVCLFSIYFSKQIKKEEPKLKNLIKRSGLPPGYENEVSKGLRIAEYVVLNDSGVELIESLMDQQ